MWGERRGSDLFHLVATSGSYHRDGHSRESPTLLCQSRRSAFYPGDAFVEHDGRDSVPEEGRSEQGKDE